MQHIKNEINKLTESVRESIDVLLASEDKIFIEPFNDPQITANVDLDNLIMCRLIELQDLELQLTKINARYVTNGELTELTGLLNDYAQLRSKLITCISSVKEALHKHRGMANGIVYINDKEVPLIKKIQHASDLLIKKANKNEQLVNPFIIFDKPTNAPFVNYEELLTGLKELKDAATDGYRKCDEGLKEAIIKETIILTEFITGEAFSEVSRVIDFGNSSTKNIWKYEIIINQSSLTYELLKEKLTSGNFKVNILAIVGWELTSCIMTDEGEIKFSCIFSD